MEALQLAQMLADLNDLQAAQDQGAAKALVAANKTKNEPSAVLHTQSHGTPSAVDSRIASPAGRFDKLGRRIFTPPLSRTNSSYQDTPSSSIPGTPRKELPDTDIDRASTLLSLYEIRAKLREQDSSSLQKAREKINALAAKQAQVVKEQQQATFASTSAPKRKDPVGSNRSNHPK
ncbi:hypothetical protein BJ170DRAFT_677389 [Xylariales sp. AK1849]|nr:hypothetical protein BJ170DRAFT_677389 [Xylariales sp. AK1849]